MSTQAWQTADMVVGAPVVRGDGTVFIESNGLTARSPDDGHVFWRGPPCGDPALGPDGTIFCGALFTDLPRMGAIDPSTHDYRWTAEGIETDLPLTVAVDGTLYVVAAGQVSARRPSDGHELWHAGPAATSVAIGLDGAVLVAADAVVRSLDPQNGKLRWSATLDGPIGLHPTVGGDGNIYVVGKQLFALNPDDGHVAWTFEGDLATGRVVSVAADGTIYLVGAADCTALTPEGHPKWVVDDARWLFQRAAVIGGDGTIYIAGRNVGNTVLAVDSSGTQRRPILGLPITTEPLALGPDGLLYLTGLDGRLHAIGP
jgi:hypothetical protein